MLKRLLSYCLVFLVIGILAGCGASGNDAISRGYASSGVGSTPLTEADTFNLTGGSYSLSWSTGPEEYAQAGETTSIAVSVHGPNGDYSNYQLLLSGGGPGLDATTPHSGRSIVNIAGGTYVLDVVTAAGTPWQVTIQPAP
jgi:hypothetical protein